MREEGGEGWVDEKYAPLISNTLLLFFFCYHLQKIVGGLPPEPKEVCVLTSDIITAIFSYACHHVGRQAVEVYSKSLVKLQTIQQAGMDIQHNHT